MLVINLFQMQIPKIKKSKFIKAVQHQIVVQTQILKIHQLNIAVPILHQIIIDKSSNEKESENINESNTKVENQVNNKNSASNDPNSNEHKNEDNAANFPQIPNRKSQKSDNQEMISIDNFDPNIPKKINEYQTLEAMRYISEL